MNRWITVPNVLTMTRMALSPVIGYMILHQSYHEAFYWLVFAGGLDWADGYVARQWNQQSIQGSFLDPLADKALMTCTLLPLAFSGVLNPYAVGVMFVRDAGLVAGAFAFRALSKPTDAPFFSMSRPEDDFRVSISTVSKVNTALQVLLVSAGTAVAAFAPDAGVARAVLDALTVAAVVTTCWSGLDYVGTARRMLAAAKQRYTRPPQQ